MENGSVYRRADQFDRVLTAHHVLVAELTPDGVLHRLVELARDIFGAEQAAILLREADTRTYRIIDTGVGADTRTASKLPEPLPVLMSAPVRHGSSHFGQLHLLGTSALLPTDDEQELLDSLAATAAIAIQNSLLHEEAKRQQDALLAFGAVSRELLAGRPRADVLQHIGEALLGITAAAGVLVLAPNPADPDLLDVVAHASTSGEDLRGQQLLGEESVARVVVASGEGAILPNVAGQMVREAVNGEVDPRVFDHLMALPLLGDAVAGSAVLIYRTSGRPFSEAEFEIATALARQAALALERAEDGAARSRLSVLELRGRIAEELNRQVVQSIFSIGLTIQGIASLAPTESSRERLAATVDSLDEAARTIRATVFPRPAAKPSGRGPVALNEPVLAVLEEVAELLGFEPALSLAGPLNAVADARLADDVLAVVRESLTNVAKYSRATEVSVELRAQHEKLLVRVVDNGVGLALTGRRSGLANLRRRAEARGGSLTVEEPSGGGLALSWTVPVQLS